MKHIIAKTGTAAVLLLAVAIVVCLLSSGCHRKYPGDKGQRDEKDTALQLVIWKKPQSSQADFDAWVNSKFPDDRVTKKYFCQHCDSTLIMLTGPGPDLFIQTVSGGSGGTKIPGTSGEDGPAFFSTNIRMYFNDSLIEKNYDIKPLPVTTPTKEPVTVAVFDTGIDPEGFENMGNKYSSSITSCLSPQANDGWNFADTTNVTSDNHLNKHGSIVSRFIVDQVNQYGGNGVKILPVKVFDAAGGSNLFSILCGIAYAKDRGAKIINGSFGYYAPRFIRRNGLDVEDSSAYLFKGFIQNYLTDSNILFVVAAGNMDDANERAVFTSHGLPYPSDPRNLEEVSFYPASFARDLNNVITVTTVNRSNVVSPNQNYSNQVVDIGVNADDISFVFQNPINPGLSVIGTSFATPIVTGKLCANYDTIRSLLNTSTYTKDQIFTQLSSIMSPNPALASSIKAPSWVTSKEP
jgi:hypothetical protein